MLLTRTLHGVVKNIQHLCKRDRSKIWGAYIVAFGASAIFRWLTIHTTLSSTGKDGWKKVVVCIVSDGRKKIHSRSLSVLAAMGVYQDGVAKNVGMCLICRHFFCEKRQEPFRASDACTWLTVNGKPVTAHIYE